MSERSWRWTQGLEQEAIQRFVPSTEFVNRGDSFGEQAMQGVTPQWWLMTVAKRMATKRLGKGWSQLHDRLAKRYLQQIRQHHGVI